MIINGVLELSNCKKLKSLGKLKEVELYIYLKGSGITREYVEKNHLHLLKKCEWS